MQVDMEVDMKKTKGYLDFQDFLKHLKETNQKIRNPLAFFFDKKSVYNVLENPIFYQEASTVFNCDYNRYFFEIIEGYCIEKNYPLPGKILCDLMISFCGSIGIDPTIKPKECECSKSRCYCCCQNLIYHGSEILYKHVQDLLKSFPDEKLIDANTICFPDDNLDIDEEEELYFDE
jgi:hypothetical protein